MKLKNVTADPLGLCIGSCIKRIVTKNNVDHVKLV